jgi:hypothetical protein
MVTGRKPVYRDGSADPAMLTRQPSTPSDRATSPGWGPPNDDPEGYFGPTTVRWYPAVQWFDGAGIADHLRSLSPYRRLDHDVREPLLDAIADRVRTKMGIESVATIWRSCERGSGRARSTTRPHDPPCPRWNDTTRAAGNTPREQGRRMPEHPKALVVRKFYEAFESDDPETAVRGFLDPDITWHVAGHNALAGTFRGPDQVWDAMTRYGEHSHGTLQLDTRSVFADDEHTVAIHRASA